MIDALKFEEFDNAQNKIGHYCSKIGDLLHFFHQKCKLYQKRGASGDAISVFSLEGVDLL